MWGQSKISYSLSEVLTRLFGSETLKVAIRTRVAASYTNLFMDNSGIIYAATQDSRDGEIKKLNAVGTNIYRDYHASSGFLNTIQEQFDYDFDDLSFHFGDTTLKTPNFCDLTVNDYGVVTAIDTATSKVFQYDSEGNLLCVFGAIGDGDGYFQMSCFHCIGYARKSIYFG